MLILRIRQAETALADGRLDEAFDLASRSDVRSHRHGQRLAGRLAAALASRGREHLAADRPTQAGADCDKAIRLGGNQPEAAELKAAIAEAVQAERREDRLRADAAEAARRAIRDGRLSAGEALLADVPAGGNAGEPLRREAVARRAAADGALTRAKRAIEDEDWTAAIDALTEARHQHSSSESAGDLIGAVTAEVVARLRSAIHQGKLDLAGTLLSKLTPLAGDRIEVQELRGVLDHCRHAAELVADGRPREAAEALHRMAAMATEADWVTPALRAAEQAAENAETLRGGPLGLIMADIGTGRAVAGPSRDTVPLPARAVPARAGGQSDGGAFMIQADGIGSFLVLRDRRVRIAPASSSRPAELRVVADGDMPEAEIQRADDDYFLASSSPVRVNERAITQRLLANGDKIALAARCRFRFTLPNPASTTAVLQLSGARLPNPDVRRVVLLDREIVMGPGPSAHIRADALAEPVVLQWKAGRLLCRSKLPVRVHDRPIGPDEPIGTGDHVRIGTVSFVVTDGG